MNLLTNKMKQLFSILLVFTLIFAWFPGAAGAESTDADSDYSEEVDEAIESAVAYIIDKGIFSEWEAIGVNRAGYDVPEQYWDQFQKTLESQVVTPSKFAKVTDVTRFVLASQAIQLDPTELEGTNIVEKIYNSENHPGGMDTMTLQGNNGPVFALISLDSGKFTVPEDARWTREKLVDYLLEQQLENGGWPLAGSKASIDITSMAIIALSNYQDHPKVEEAISQAVAYLSAQQGEEGGFDVKVHGGISSESTSQAIIGLTSAGLDPLAADFTKNGNNLIDHLLTFATEDGGFKHVPGDETSNAMGTEQALQALVAYKLYLNNDGKLYDFSNKEEPTPEPAEEVIEVGKKIDITNVEEVKIKGSKAKITLPEELPEGAKLTIKESNDQKTPYKANKLDLSGDLYDFVFEGIDDFDATYELTLGVDDSTKIDDANIYHFNEQAQEWELVESTIDYDSHTLTVTVDHFSVYGVFTKHTTGDEEDKNEGPDTETEEDEDQNPSENNGKGKEDDNDSVIDATKIDSDLIIHSKENKDGNQEKDNVVTTSQNKDEDGERLPETATNAYNFMLVGILILSLGLILFGIRKKVATKKIDKLRRQ